MAPSRTNASHSSFVAWGFMGWRLCLYTPCRKIRQLKSLWEMTNGSWQWRQVNIWSVGISSIEYYNTVILWQENEMKWNEMKWNEMKWNEMNECLLYNREINSPVGTYPNTVSYGYHERFHPVWLKWRHGVYPLLPVASGSARKYAPVLVCSFVCISPGGIGL